MDKHTRLSIAALLAGAALSACCQTPAVGTPAATDTTSPPGMVGNDRDAHGCIGSAGYSWCAREQACVRSWELAASKGFANSAEGFDQYCAGKP